LTRRAHFTPGPNSRHSALPAAHLEPMISSASPA
jgi:hypothetical protein